jgi:glutamine synthetase
LKRAKPREALTVDITERESRRSLAESLRPALANQGVVAVATSFVDNSGITRVKSVPLDRLPQLAAWGAGFSPSFDYFRFDDWMAAPPGGWAPVGDLRLMPDIQRVVPLVAQPGWAWAPADRYRQDGEPHENCSRQLLLRLTESLADQGLAIKAGFEIEWVVAAGDSEPLKPAVEGSGYGMSRLITASAYARDLIDALVRQGIAVEQFHPEAGAGQLEVSVAAESPVEAADTSVLVRSTIRAVGDQYGYRTSFSPKVDPTGVGNGGHVHLSAWRDGQNLMTAGAGHFGLTQTAEAFAAGILQRLPALLAIGAPSVASYLRLVPSSWAGAYCCWGLENREAALRMITGSTGSGAWAANLEVKCIDLTANPYLVLAGLLAAASTGIDSHARLPEPIDVDPAALDDQVLNQRGIQRLPTTLQSSVQAFAADDVLRAALGDSLVNSIIAVRESEIELFAGASAEEIVRATRWAH